MKNTIAPTTLKPMILRASLTSPYGRKVRIAAHVLGISDLINVVHADTLDPEDTVRVENPLGKLPTLLLSDGRSFFDSRTILEFFHDSVSSSMLLPSDPLGKALMRTQIALCDGITDASLLLVYEGRFRENTTYSDRWLSHQRGKIFRALDKLSNDLPPLSLAYGSSISLVCALGYLDWRQPVEWRIDYPKVADWLKQISILDPAVAATAIPT